MDTTDLLKGIPLFSELGEKELLYLAQKTYEKIFKKNTIIFQKGERSGFLGILLSGRLKVILLSPQGREVNLAILEPYGYIGEMSLLDNEPHSATVMALKKSKLLILPQTAFHELLKEHPETGIFLLKQYVKLVRNLSERIADLKFMDIYQRTAKKLVEMGLSGKPLEITHQELANLVGSNRENITRSLNEMEKRELIYMKKRKIIIKKSKEIEEIYKDF
ncbi:MAG TPA: Crp/Fnr family transcriptional regulator [Candidatus Eremiobacteraeota bacterium]|nr:MAG: cAMP receptor protein [bacterium ADurb.Bin363]HPZ08966.1 Crp/Fnr family transcriptional regulator [Candidatus Eremiobacteraeota bacterium]